ncbi:MAG: tripartite tricarboxylate transporter substrate binding protein [Kaiparowitsia implicata GSE-PSE-MK54-09C]|jgi:tripartite-type tricarboxylate transporter receptor subunit TctC|nr:tripartite tricarboxylate transporter substrate binding protein [Kaiparowitsia implicata GSE-PSE-MK54-09C]
MFRLHTALCAAVAVLTISQPAIAAEWPTGTVTIIVPYTPGNITDIAARIVAQKLQESTGQSFIVENKPGASTQIGTAEVARAKPDGHTLLITGAGYATNPALFDELPYDTDTDLTPVGLVVSNPLVLVTAADKPFPDFVGLVDYAKSNPGQLTMASGGNGTLSHMAEALTALATGTDLIHVPYKGGSAAATDTLSGHVDSMWDNPSSAMPQIEAGRIRALAVSGAYRSDALPDVPTVSELGYGNFEVVNWFAMFAPGETDVELLDTIHDQVQAALEQPDVQERFGKDGVTAGGPSRAEFTAFVAAETEKWGQIIRENGIHAD